jgi:hypothetical protein
MLRLYPYGLIAAVLSINPRAKHSRSISLISVVVMVIPTREGRSWKDAWQGSCTFLLRVFRRTLRSIGVDEGRDEVKENNVVGLAAARLFIA